MEFAATGEKIGTKVKGTGYGKYDFDLNLQVVGNAETGTAMIELVRNGKTKLSFSINANTVRTRCNDSHMTFKPTKSFHYFPNTGD